MYFHPSEVFSMVCLHPMEVEAGGCFFKSGDYFLIVGNRTLLSCSIISARCLK